MSKNKKTDHIGKDEKMDLIGIPINPYEHAKLPAKSPYWKRHPWFIVAVFILSILIIVLVLITDVVFYLTRIT